jgi:hypothetical protein
MHLTSRYFIGGSHKYDELLISFLAQQHPQLTFWSLDIGVMAHVHVNGDGKVRSQICNLITDVIIE